MQTSRFERLCRASEERRVRLRGRLGDRYPAFVRRRVRDICGLVDTPLSISVASEECGTVDNVMVRRLTFTHDRRSGLRAVLLKPETAEQLHPAVLVLPGKFGRLEEVSGLEAPDYPDRNVGLRLARAGFVALVYEHGISAPNTEDHSAADTSAALALAGQPALGAFVEDALELFDWLRARPEVDSERTSLFGHSMGAATALHTALAMPYPVCLSVASYLGSYECMFRNAAGANPCAALPGILQFAELADLFCALPGGPLHVQYGVRDRILDTADAAECGRVIGERYRVSTDQKVEVHALDMGHGTDCDAVIRFLRSALPGNLSSKQSAPRQVAALRIDFPPLTRSAILSETSDILATGDLSMSERTAHFEATAAEWVTGRPIAVASGSAALDLIFRDIGVQDRCVLVPANTFFATAAAVVRAGGVPVFCDIDPVGLGIDPDAVAAEIEARDNVAAVVTIHLGGIISAKSECLHTLTQNAGIPLVEDAAHALGSFRRRRGPGAFGDYAAFSMYATKVATAGEGGLVVAADSAAEGRIRTLLDHGKDEGKRYHVALGGNARISELHAAVGSWSLESLPDALVRRRALLEYYRAALSGQSSIEMLESSVQTEENGYKCIATLDESLDRDQVKRWLAEERGVALAGEVYSRPLPTEPYFVQALRSGVAQAQPSGWPVASRFTGQHVCLPIYPSLSTADASYVAASLLDAIRHVHQNSL